MTKPTPEASPESTQRIVLASDESAGKIGVPLSAYEEFNLYMTERLAQLEQQFAAFRTPKKPKSRGSFHAA